MKGLKEIGIPLLLWTYFLSEGLRGAMVIPEMKIEPNDPLPIPLKVLACAATFVVGYLAVFVNSKRRKMSFEYWIERRLSEETSRKISKRANFPMLAASFFGLIGLGGLVKAAVLGAPQINMDLLQIVASMGIGCFLAGTLTRKPIPEPK